MDPEIQAYIEENREKYTRQAIDAHLLQAGWTQAQIDAAWSRVEQAGPAERRDAPFGYALTYAFFLVAGLGFIAGSVALFTLIVASANPIIHVDSRVLPLDLLVAILFLVLAIGTYPPRLVTFTRKGWSLGKLMVTAIILFVAWALIGWGTCVYGPNLLR